MRISTKTLYETGTTRIGDLQSSLSRTQQQLATNRRILTPSDDPVAASRALEVSQSQAINEQLAVNRQSARSILANEEGVLQSVTGLLQTVKTTVVQAGNAVLDDTQRKFLATDLRQQLDALVSLANTRDGTGGYLFAGYKVGAPPFSKSATGTVQYVGDQGQQALQVGQARQMLLADPGSAVFGGIPANGVYRTTAGATNTGTGTISPVTVTDPSLVKGHQYHIQFGAGGATFQIYDDTLDPATPLAMSVPPLNYVAGQPIDFDGLQVNISNAPANGDKFVVESTGRQSVFDTLNNLINLLETPVSGPAGNANLTYGLSNANANIDNALDNVLTVRASLGSRLKELDSLDSLGDDLDVQYKSTLSALQDVDYVKAISDLTQQKISLEAAQQSFVKIASLSLFNYIN